MKSLVSTLVFVSKIDFYLMSMSVFMCVCLCTMCKPGAHRGQKVVSDSLSYILLWATTCMLGVKPGLSVTSALNH